MKPPSNSRFVSVPKHIRHSPDWVAAQRVAGSLRRIAEALERLGLTKAQAPEGSA